MPFIRHNNLTSTVSGLESRPDFTRDMDVLETQTLLSLIKKDDSKVIELAMDMEKRKKYFSDAAIYGALYRLEALGLVVKQEKMIGELKSISWTVHPELKKEMTS
mgnify:CR=1 FL=1